MGGRLRGDAKGRVRGLPRCSLSVLPYETTVVPFPVKDENGIWFWLTPCSLCGQPPSKAKGRNFTLVPRDYIPGDYLSHGMTGHLACVERFKTDGHPRTIKAPSLIGFALGLMFIQPFVNWRKSRRVTS